MKLTDLEKATRIALLSYVDMLQNTINAASRDIREVDELRKENKLSEDHVNRLLEQGREKADTIHNLNIKLAHLKDEVLKTSKQYEYAMEWSEAQSEKIASLEQSAQRNTRGWNGLAWRTTNAELIAARQEIEGLKRNLRASKARSEEWEVEWEHMKARLKEALEGRRLGLQELLSVRGDVVALKASREEIKAEAGRLEKELEEMKSHIVKYNQELLLARESLEVSQASRADLLDRLHRLEKKLTQRAAEASMAAAEKNKTYPAGGPAALVERLARLMEDNPLPTMAQINKEQHRSLQRFVGMWTSLDHAGSSFIDKSSEDKGE